jgi:broad specificity phosphatase PhoE
VTIEELYHLSIPPGNSGESLSVVYSRACQAVNNMLNYEPGRYLIVSHGLFLNLVLYAILGLEAHHYAQGPRFRFGNAGYLGATYNWNQKRWLVHGFKNQEDLGRG